MMEYTPLDFPTFEFRLLALLQPGDDEAADALVRCTLKHDYLIERFDEETGTTIPVPDYVALSYCCTYSRVVKIHCLLTLSRRAFSQSVLICLIDALSLAIREFY
jgi:hypothetical protein